MPDINTYLTFNKQCEEAFNFYRTVFGGEFSYFSRFKEIPPQDAKDIHPEDAELIMHVSLPIGEHSALMGSDSPSSFGDQMIIGNNFSISVGVDSTGEADRIFAALSKDGTIVMPLENTFWGSYFGMLTDRFGVNWMVGYDKPEN